MSVLVNGSMTKEFSVSRGLRQGDLSLFLFLISMEGFSVMVNRAVELGMFKGFWFGEVRQQVSHLQFVNDTRLYAKIKKEYLGD